MSSLPRADRRDPTRSFATVADVPRSEPAGSEPAGSEPARVWRRIRALVIDRNERRREVCEALDLSFIRVKALLALQAGALTLGELAAALSIDRPYTTLTVHELERRGLAERTVHPDDRRSKLVELTASGRMAARLADDMLNRPPAALVALDAADLAALDRITALLAGEHPDATS
ncbi:MarR family winged helix-turn-helix transcriptional regulator [Frankia gtarii]|uniref:MarR family winged helix-turn-helix transcriptional regulator n=1 Tax=Frankia gtarii TaxID=2950102 RepID=UPI0021C1B8AF|nr:MarR family transcriptional regulator [Frankia gtarii]